MYVSALQRSPHPAIFHLHKALVGVSLAVAATDWVVLAGADPAAPGELEPESGQAVGDGGHIDMATEKWDIHVVT